MRFGHIADLHLGYNQYNLEARAQDIARAFWTACSEAVKSKCSLMLIAGDLFHKRTTNSKTFLQAIGALSIVRKAGILTIIVPGNHDGPWRSGERTWLSVLDSLGYFTLLDVSIQSGQLNLEKAIYETEEIRVVGIPYLGAALPRIIPQIVEQLSQLPRKYTVLMLHAGLEGEVPGFRAVLTKEDLEPLRPYVDYVAMGHIHKPFEHDNRIFNPGSLEALAADETEYEGGWYLVDVDGKQHTAKHILYEERRPFRRLRLDVSKYQNAEQLRKAAAILGKQQEDLSGRGAMLELSLLGKLQFVRVALDIPSLANVLADDLEPLKMWIRDRTDLEQIEIAAEEGLSRSQMEEQILGQLIGHDAHYVEQGPELSQLAAELKAAVLAGEDGEDVWNMAINYNITDRKSR